MEHWLKMETFFMTMFISYRNQSVSLHSKLIDWFLYEANIAIKNVKQQTANHLVYNNLFRKLNVVQVLDKLLCLSYI